MEVLSDPISVLPIKSAKFARDCSEMHLSDRGITHLDNFGMFPNIETIYLNNNKLKRISNLD